MGMYFDVVIFDLDDILVEKSDTFNETIKKCLNYYLCDFAKIAPAATELITDADIEQLRRTGFTHDSDVLYAAIVYFLNLLSKEYNEDDYLEYKGTELFDVIAKNDPVEETCDDLLKKKRINEFARMIAGKGGGMKGLNRLFGLKNSWMALYEGHILMDNMIKRIYMEYYLGEELFHTIYSQPRVYIREDGTINRHSLRIHPKYLFRMKKMFPLCVVSDRTYYEARYLLKTFDALNLFDSIATIDSGISESEMHDYGVSTGMEKTYSQMIIEAVESLRGYEELSETPRICFIGCFPDEAKSLSQLKEKYHVTIVGLVSKEENAQEIQKKFGINNIVRSNEQILSLFGIQPEES
ncbi:MAG: hypothetical protein FJ088_03250 [Deltaproteobacteria bacterium]|nr:hypothetical protein [Deltaproteobacteria bacterium]